MPHLGEELKRWRKQNNKDQKQMAEYLGIKYRTYQSIEGSGIVKKIADLTKIQKKTALNTQITAHSETAVEKAITALSDGYTSLIETHKEVVSTNKMLASMLRVKINSGGTGVASPSSQKKTSPGKNRTVQKKKILDTGENDLVEKKDQKKDISVD